MERPELLYSGLKMNAYAIDAALRTIWVSVPATPAPSALPGLACFAHSIRFISGLLDQERMRAELDDEGSHCGNATLITTLRISDGRVYSGGKPTLHSHVVHCAVNVPQSTAGYRQAIGRWQWFNTIATM